METRENITDASGGFLSIFSKVEQLAGKYADRRTDGYPLINSFYFQLGITSVYLFICLYAGPKLMANRKPFKLEKTIRAYNIMQILACGYIIYTSIANKWSFRRALFTTCYPVDPNPTDQRILNIIGLFYFTYLLKLSEFIETMFFVLRKKFNQVSALHLYHHVSTLYIVWWGARTYPGGLALFPIIMNCFVHILMYTYYLIANFGPKWQTWVSPVKPYITIIQMTQFTILIFMSFILLSPFYCSEGPRTFGYIFLSNVILVYYLFYQFFKRTYLGTDHPNKSGQVDHAQATARQEIYRKVQEQELKNGTKRGRKTAKVA